MFKKILLIVASGISLFAMHSAEININQKDLELGLNLDMGQYNRTVEPDTTFLGLRYLNGNSYNSNDENGNKVNTKYFAELNFMIKQEIKNSGLKVGLGVKTNISSVSDLTFISIPLGLNLSYELPLKNFIPIEIGAEVYYAPESLSFSDASNYLEYRAGLRLEVIERGSIFLGYRDINTNYIGYDVTYNKSAYFGFKFEF